MAAHDLADKAPETPYTDFVVIHLDDFEKILLELHALKGWSMHTENGDYEQKVVDLVRDVVRRDRPPFSAGELPHPHDGFFASSDEGQNYFDRMVEKLKTERIIR